MIFWFILLGNNTLNFIMELILSFSKWPLSFKAVYCKVHLLLVSYTKCPHGFESVS